VNFFIFQKDKKEKKDPKTPEEIRQEKEEYGTVLAAVLLFVIVFAAFGISFVTRCKAGVWFSSEEEREIYILNKIRKEKGKEIFIFVCCWLSHDGCCCGFFFLCWNCRNVFFL
jgi:hypothetical protein